MRFTVTLCRNAAALLVVLMFAAPLATRAGLLHFSHGILLVAIAFAAGLVLLLAALAMLALPAFRAWRAQSTLAALLAGVPVAAGLAVMLPATGLPAIHDISTDLADPPRFEALVAERGAGSNPLERGAEVDAAQRAAYPALGPIESPLPPEAAFARAAATARALGWDIEAQDPARGLLEASATTFWFGFVDDVVIRVRPHAGGARIDLRSVSRVGKGDLGANAARIERFAEAFSG